MLIDWWPCVLWLLLSTPSLDVALTVRIDDGTLIVDRVASWCIYPSALRAGPAFIHFRVFVMDCAIQTSNAPVTAATAELSSFVGTHNPTAARSTQIANPYRCVQNCMTVV